MGTRGDHEDAFDRDRWGQSVADQTLFITTIGDEQGESQLDDIGCEPRECGLCDEEVLPINDDGTACCPICGFAVTEPDSTLRPSDRIGSR